MGNDADRFRRFLDGDDNGLVEIIDAYHESLTLFLNSFVQDPELAEEFMQETFVRLATKKPPFRGRCSFKTWLFTIARNCAIDYLRKNRRLIPLDEQETLPDDTNIELEYLREEQKRILHKALRQIRPDYAQALYLMYFEYHAYDDFAPDNTDHGTHRASHGNDADSDAIHNGAHRRLIGIADHGFDNNNSGAD